MAFLPLSLTWQPSESGDMYSTISHQAGAIRRLASRVGLLVAECNEATRLLTTLADTPDRYPVDPDRAPDTYAEFLVRTAGLATREPDRH
jgi:hypothetical protein